MPTPDTPDAAPNDKPTLQLSPASTIFGKPVDRAIIFSNFKGIHKSRIERRQRNLLVKIPFITTFLKDSRSLVTTRERILLITTGYGPLTPLERTVLRPVTVFLRRSIFIFTESRFFYVPTSFKYSYRESVAEIRYSDCSAISIAGRSIIVVFKRGMQLEFPFISGRERKKLKALFPLLPVGGFSAKPGGMRHLCPQCATPLAENSHQCASCDLTFKSVVKAGRMALFLPGGGYIYTRNVPLAIGSILIETALMVGIIIAAFQLTASPVLNLLTLVGCLLALVGVKMVAFQHGRQLAGDVIPD